MGRRRPLMVVYTCPELWRASYPRHDDERGQRCQRNQGPSIIDGINKGNLLDERSQHRLLFGIEQRWPKCGGWNSQQFHRVQIAGGKPIYKGLRMFWRVCVDHGIDDRDSKGAAEIAHEVEQTAGICDGRLCQLS